MKWSFSSITFCFSFRGRQTGTMFWSFQMVFIANLRGLQPGRGKGTAPPGHRLDTAGVPRMLVEGTQVFQSRFSVISPWSSSWKCSQQKSSRFVWALSWELSSRQCSQQPCAAGADVAWVSRRCTQQQRPERRQT